MALAILRDLLSLTEFVNRAEAGQIPKTSTSALIHFPGLSHPGKLRPTPWACF